MTKYLVSIFLLFYSVTFSAMEPSKAVEAVFKEQTKDVRFIAQLIKSSVIKARASKSKNMLETAIKFNAKTMSNFLKQSQIISEGMSQNKVDVISAYYNFDTGAVEIL